MENISAIRFTPLPPDSPYVKPFRMYYIQNGEEKSWDLLKVHDSVVIITFNKTRNTLVFVKQFRPAVYYSIISSDPTNTDLSKLNLDKYPAKLGITLELCAGIVDKTKSLIEIAQEELLEECGYKVPLDRLEEIMTYRSGVGTTGSKQTLYYAEVTDADKETTGGGVGDEIIDVVELTLDESRALVSQGTDNNAPPSCLLGVMWFLSNKAPKFHSHLLA